MHERLLRALPRAVPAAAAAVTLLTPGGAGAAPTPSRHALPGSVPAWARAQRDRGAADGAQRVQLRVYLPLRDSATAEQLARAVSDPGSAAYGQYLTPEQFRSRFAPTAAQLGAVTTFLQANGLSVGEIPDNRHSVEVTGTLAQAQRAFGVTVHRYAYRGRLLDAPTSEPTVPAGLADDVVAVNGLSDGGSLTRPLSRRGTDAGPAPAPPAPDAPVTPVAKGRPGPVPPPDGFRNARPCSAFYGEQTATTLPPAYGAPAPYVPCGYTPSQFQGAYGLAGPIAHGTDGRGQTVAIVDAYAAPTILADANTYATRHGQASFAAGQFTQSTPRQPYRYGYNDPQGDQCGEQGWYGEETLDVEAVHATAPGAKVLYVAGRSCDDGDLDAAVNKIVDQRLANIVTNSYGDLGEDLPPAEIVAEHLTFLQATLEGIGVYFSSGDDGDESASTVDGSPTGDFPATDPLVTAVGGTSLGVGAAGQRLFETGWATGISQLAGNAWTPAPPGDFLYGGGGGVSSVFPEPYYQRGVVPDGVAGGRRAEPDVALDGDPQTGMLVGETQTFPEGAHYDEYRIGGTSLASPLMAGVAALADQAARRPHGFINPALYRAAGSAALTDVVPDGTKRAVARVDYANSVDTSAGLTTTLRSLDDEAQSLHLAPGWDNLTGVGTPAGAAFLGLGGLGAWGKDEGALRRARVTASGYVPIANACCRPVRPRPPTWLP